MWDKAIDCKDPPFDPLAKAEPAPATNPAPAQEPRGEPTSQSPTPPATAQATWSAGFDCNKARTQVEHMICANQDLSAADHRMVELYREVMAAAMDKPAFKREQDNWRSMRRDTCPDVACVRKAYVKRNEELENLVALTQRHIFVGPAGTGEATQ
ncbi:lysozyme inhibitor LprI family protein [Cupriavidus basilensis]